MKARNSNVAPKALRDVWNWKDTVYRQSEGLDLSDALRQIHRDADGIRKEFAFHVVAPQASVPRVAEKTEGYGAE